MKKLKNTCIVAVIILGFIGIGYLLSGDFDKASVIGVAILSVLNTYVIADWSIR